MLDIKLSDFKVGEKCFVEFIGNAGRHKPIGYYEEWIVTGVSAKYVTANRYKFEEHDFSYGGLKERTNNCVDYVIYPTEQLLKDRLELEETYEYIKSKFGKFSRDESLTLDKLRRMKAIIEE